MGDNVQAGTHSARLKEISRILTNARRAAAALPGFPGPLPDSFADAYEVQRLSREAWTDDLVGWKVGGVPPAFKEHFQEDWLVGPIFARNAVPSDGAARAQMPVFVGGFAAIEPEFILQVGETRDQDRLFVGAEIASSPLPAINDIGPIAVICDFGNNRGMLTGPEITDWQASGADPVNVTTHIDGEIIATKNDVDFAAMARRSRDFLLAHAAKHRIAVAPGTRICTGAITGVHEAAIGAQSTLDFGRFGSVDLELTTASPESATA